MKIDEVVNSDPARQYSSRRARFSRGIVYHGTTRVQADDILKNGFRVIPYDDLVRDVLNRLGVDPEQISRQKQKALERERQHYEYAGEPMISSAPSPEVASRWAGSGGEVPKCIEAIIRGRGTNWRDPRSPLTGEPVVLELTLNPAGRQAPNFLSYLETLNRLDGQVQSGRLDPAKALDTLVNHYVDIKLLPTQIGRVTVLGKFTDQGGNYTKWLGG